MRIRIVHKLLLLIAAFGGALTVPATAQVTLPESMYRCEGIRLAYDAPSPATPAGLAGRVEDLFGGISHNEPGIAVIVLQDDGILAMRQYGLASLEHRVPFSPNHAVRLPYSEGREFLAIAAAFMERDRLISLEDRVRSYYPELPAWSDRVTIRDLIFHHSGFVDEWSVLLLMQASMENRFDTSQFLRLLAEQPEPEVEPHTGYMYSNSDYGLLRLILEQKSGGDLPGYMDRRIFTPLGMRSTRLATGDKEVIPDRAPFYSEGDDGWRYSFTKTSPGGDYSIVTSACDLARWAGTYAEPDSEVALAVGRLMENATPISGRAGHFPFGHTHAESDGKPVIRHEGVNTINYLTRLPESGFSVITLGNRYHEPSGNLAIVEYLLGHDEDDILTRYPSKPVFTEDLEQFTGRYVSDGLPSWESETMAREMIHIQLREGALHLSWPDWGPLELIPVGGASFSWHDGPGEHAFGMLLHFTEQESSGLPQLEIQYNDGFPSENFVQLAEWTPAPDFLEKIKGTYYNRYLDFSWTIDSDDAGLYVRAATMPDTRLDPYQKGEFLLRQEKFDGVPENIWIRFHENEDGKIAYLTAWHPRLMNHRFYRR